VKDLLVVGVGSPFGDDRLGWQALDALQASGWRPAGFRVRYAKADRPGTGLLELFAATDAAVLLDALLAQEPAGGARLVGRQELALWAQRTSSHALGVAEVLALGERLGMLPRQLWIIGLVPGRLDHEALLGQLQAALPSGDP
jgi:hydrogenase maturation protease